MPRISVILPVYNTEKYVWEAVQSILNQSYSDFELLVINDASTDRTLEILDKIKDPRLSLVNNEQNFKVVKTLNKGLGLANSEFIARMDADDISHPQRFEKQIKFFDDNPNIDVVGSWGMTFGLESKVLKAATEHEHIKARLFFLNPILHSALMFKRQSFQKYNLKYDEHFTNAEDYGLWVKAIDKIRFANIPEILLKYRIHTSNVSVIKASNRKELDEIHDYIYGHFLDKLNVRYNGDELLMHRKLGLSEVEDLTPKQLNEYLQWLKKLVISNFRINYFNRVHFKNVILSCVVYVVKQTRPLPKALKLALNTFNGIYNLNDFLGYLTVRAKVKLKHAQEF